MGHFGAVGFWGGFDGGGGIVLISESIASNPESWN